MGETAQLGAQGFLLSLLEYLRGEGWDARGGGGQRQFLVMPEAKRRSQGYQRPSVCWEMQAC